MNKTDLMNKAKIVFENYNTENVLYCIDDGNFWTSKNITEARYYSMKMKKQLITFNREDVFKPVKPIETIKKIEKIVENKPKAKRTRKNTKKVENKK